MDRELHHEQHLAAVPVRGDCAILMIARTVKLVVEELAVSGKVWTLSAEQQPFCVVSKPRFWRLRGNGSAIWSLTRFTHLAVIEHIEKD